MQTDRQTDIQTERQTEKHIAKQTDIHTIQKNIHTNTQHKYREIG